MLDIEVAYALPDRQKIIKLSVAEGCTALEAVKQSNIEAEFAGLVVEDAKFGIFGKAVKHDYRMRAGDRVEIYRPLIADPKASRKARAAKASSEKKL